MNELEQINWSTITFTELDMILKLTAISDVSFINEAMYQGAGNTPLCAACLHKREDLVSIILQHGALVKKSCSYLDQTPLHFASNHRHGNLGIVRKIIEAKADVNALNINGNTSLFLACLKKNIPAVKLLLENGANADIPGKDGATALLEACSQRNVEMVKVLLEAGCDVNLPLGSPLYMSLHLECPEISKLLIQAGADLRKRPYFMVALQHHTSHEILQMLYENGADINEASSAMCPLIYACKSKDISIVEQLLEWGADVNCRTLVDDTALHYERESLCIQRVKLLLAYGADVNAQNGFGSCPLKMHLQNMNLPKSWFNRAAVIAKVLLAAGTKVTAEDVKSLQQFFINLKPWKKKIVLDMLDNHLLQPMGLLAICRIRVRGLVRPNVDKNINFLPLPLHVKEYLQFLDIMKSVQY